MIFERRAVTSPTTLVSKGRHCHWDYILQWCFPDENILRSKFWTFISINEFLSPVSVVPVIQHYSTLIGINKVSADLAYCFGMMSPFRTLTLIVFENL